MLFEGKTRERIGESVQTGAGATELFACGDTLRLLGCEDADDDDGTGIIVFQSLKPGGYLFIGSTEQILNYKDIGYERKNSFFYERPM